MTVSPYDEVGSRTRQAWLRTSLGIVALTLLVLRSLVIGGAGLAPLLLSLVPVSVFVAVAVHRMSSLYRLESTPSSRAVGLAASGAVVALAVVALGAVATLVD